MQYPGSLHGHTEYSNLRLRDSINRIDKLIDYAIELGHEVIAFTEHESVSNVIKIEEYYNKIKENNPNFKVIYGNEIYLVRDGMNAENFVQGEDKYWHFVLLAKDAIGHQQIRELSTRAWERSYTARKMRRVPTYYADLIEIIGANPGHVIGSTACLGGFLPTKLLQYNLTHNEDLYKNIKQWCMSVENIFGKGDFYLEMQPSANQEQRIVNKLIVQLSKELDIKYIITCDEHYKCKEDAPIHKAYLNSQDGDREVDSFYATTYLMGTEELENFMKQDLTEEEINEAYRAILEIKNKCEEFSFKKTLKIPSLKWKEPKNSLLGNDTWIKRIPYLQKFFNSDFDGDVILAKMIIQRLEEDSSLQNKETYAEIDDNLKSTWISSEVNNAHWSAYYLNLQKIIDVCWDQNTLVGPGRGSGVGFILLYILGITQINPLRETTRTFSWRFLNPDRVSVLDVDVDIEGGRRAQVLQGLREYYGSDRVANVVTFGTEGAKSAIQTAARGLGLDNDLSLYIASMVPSDRGKPRTLSQCYYGDEEEGFKPITDFVKEMNAHPDLWDVARSIEGLVCRVGEHAGGVIFVDEPFTDSTALMRVPNGDLVTQFDLHDAEKASLIKYDLLSVEALDKIHTCIDLLTQYGYAEKRPTLRETYENILGIYNIERNDPKMWQMIWRHEIQSLFQMEKQSGIKGIAALKPTSVDDLAILNSTIRLMAQDGADEMPTDKLARFKRNPKCWDEEMAQYGLGLKEKTILEPVLGISYGLCIAQEQFMELVQLPELGGFNLTWADKLRKSIAKKNPREYEALTKEFYEVTGAKGINQTFAHYVWDVLIAMSRGYGFNQSHTLAYSLIGLQEMNLAYKFPIIFWNTACLVTDSGGIGANTDYNKIASAIGKMRNAGINISLPNINTSDFEFKPDVENNRILCGLKNLNNVGDDVVLRTLENRPYSSPKDFYMKVKPKKQNMISLIKGGAFDELMDRKLCMAWYIWETCDKKKRLTLQNMPGLMRYNLVPQDTETTKMAKRIYEFNRYLKSVCKHGDIYLLDERAQQFIAEIDEADLFHQNQLGIYLNPKEWDKQVYQPWMDVFRDWIASDKDNILRKLNDVIFLEDWNKYAKDVNYSKWEMDSLCFYYHEHELTNIDFDKYGIVNFNNLSEDPIVEKEYMRGDKVIKILKLYKICGTCIAKNKDKATVDLLTTTGVVTVKFRKELFSLYDKQVSQKQEDGTKKIIEKSWFNRGSMILVQGVRSGEEFVAKKYSSTGSEHQLYKINALLPNGELELLSERAKGEAEEDDE